MRRTLDTNICSYILRRHPTSMIERFAALDREQLWLSAIVAAELRFGAAKLGAPRFQAAVEAWLAYRSTAQICCSRFMMRELLEGLDPTNVELIPNGVDPRVWEPTGAIAREPLVLAWGRVQYEKGFQVLAQAMALLRGRVPGIRCVIA